MASSSSQDSGNIPFSHNHIASLSLDSQSPPSAPVLSTSPVAPKKATFPFPSDRLPPRSGPPKPDAEQRQMFAELEAIFQQAEDAQGGVGVGELRARPDFDDDDNGNPRDHRNVQALRETRQTLDQMWWSDSSYMTSAAEVMADASRDPDWRLPFGESGILDFYCGVVSSDQATPELRRHALRLVGNSCADRDSNRQIVVGNDYLPYIARHIQDISLAEVAVPVVHNICIDYEPAQAAAVQIGIGSMIISLFAGPREIFSIHSYLLGYASRLLDLVTSYTGGVNSSPENSVNVLLEYSSDPDLDLEDYTSLVNSAAIFLRNESYQRTVLIENSLELPLSVLVDSYERFDEPSTPLPPLSDLNISPQTSTNASSPAPAEDDQLSQLRNSLVQVFSDISALPEFQTAYPLESPLIGSLRLWLGLPQRELQICGCIMLGNLARSDDICQTMVQSLSLHTVLVDIVSRTSDAQLLHAAIGFLKNLSLPASNKQIIGIASLIPTLSRIWTLNTLPHIQLAATTLTRIVLTGSEPNTIRILASLSNDPDSPAYSRTYLSLLLSLFQRSDDLPTRMEIARLVVTILRNLNRMASAPDDEAAAHGRDLQKRLFALHQQDIALPLSTMVLQDRWPVVRSEGWFAFALMSRTVEGAECVTEVLVQSNMFEPLIETVVGKASSDGASQAGGESGGGSSADEAAGGAEASRAQQQRQDADAEMRRKDRENALVCASELLRHKGTFLTPARRQAFEDLLQGKQPAGLDESVRFG